MNLRIFVVLLFCCSIILLNGMVAEQISQEINLAKGKNIVIFESELTASEILTYNSQISSIRYYDEFSEQYIGYVNFNGGIGKDFSVFPGKEYEVFVKENSVLIVPVR